MNESICVNMTGLRVQTETDRQTDRQVHSEAISVATASGQSKIEVGHQLLRRPARPWR